MMSLRELILAANDRPLRAVEVPEWGCTVYLRPLNGNGRVNLLRALASNKNDAVYGDALVYAICDADGNAVFTKDDIAALNDKNGQVLERLADELVKASGAGPGAIDEAKNG